MNQDPWLDSFTSDIFSGHGGIELVSFFFNRLAISVSLHSSASLLIVEEGKDKPPAALERWLNVHSSLGFWGSTFNLLEAMLLSFQARRNRFVNLKVKV